MKYGIPGEFEKHYGTIIMYPSRQDIWRDKAVPMQDYICNLAEVISKYEKVFFFCQSSFLQKAKNVFSLNPNVFVIKSDYDDIWARDICPSFVFDNDIMKCVDWKFNAWGGIKEGAYFPWNYDDAFAKTVAEYFNFPLVHSDVVLEGGAIISDGNGTLFSTRSVVLNRNRNPFKSRDYITDKILCVTKEKRLVWLDQGLATDETNGHIDNIISFINPNELLIAWTDDTKNPNYKRVRNAYKILSNIKSCDDKEYIIHKVPLPPMQIMTKSESDGLIKSPNSLPRNAGDELPASYINFYLLNGAVIIPSFNCETDNMVKHIFEQLFPDRDVIQIFSREPLLGGGGIHCLLHEIPLEVI